MKAVTLKDGTIVSVKRLAFGDVGKLCRMLGVLSDATRTFYHDFVILNLTSYVTNYVKFQARLLLNSFQYKRGGKYFLGIVALNYFGDVVGFVYLRTKSFGLFRTATYGIVVRDDYQGKGLGDALTSRVLEYAKRLRLDVITLNVITTNDNAISLYKKYGFEIEGLHRRVDLWKDQVFDAYYMALHLNKTNQSKHIKTGDVV